MSVAALEKPAPGRLNIEAAAALTPALIIAYFAAQLLIRILISPYLETDEAQFVGQTHFALGYGNSHPPLYNWLVAGALWLTGGHWPAALALVKNALLAGTYLLAYDIGRRVAGRALVGMLAAASLLFLPQIVWKAQITLAHSVMTMFAIVATMHAVILIAQRGSLRNFIWLGIAAAIGAMSKYNYFLALVAILAAALSLPALRRAALRPQLALSFAILAAGFGPHLSWALENVEGAVGRLAKLERENRIFGALDIPYLGVDGVLAAIAGAAAWAAPLVMVWLALRRFAGGAAPEALGPDALRSFFGRAALIGFAAFLVILAAADLHYVHERYITAVLMPLPFWLVLSAPLSAGGQRLFAHAAAAIAIAMLAAQPLLVALGREQLAFPYRAFAAQLSGAGAGAAFHSAEEKYASNLSLLLNGAVWRKGQAAERVVLVWPGRSPTPPDRLLRALGPDYAPQGDPLGLSAPYENYSGHKASLGAQLYVRRP